MNITRYILPVVVGAMSGMILITLIETRIKMSMYPGPAAMMNMREMMSANGFIALIANYMACSLVAGVLCTLSGGRNSAVPAIVVGIVLTLAGIYNMTNMHHPMWFAIANVVAYLPFTYAGYMIARKKAATPA